MTKYRRATHRNKQERGKNWNRTDAPKMEQHRRAKDGTAHSHRSHLAFGAKSTDGTKHRRSAWSRMRRHTPQPAPAHETSHRT
eukprot:2812735-Pleurochrysis_carterae.AAC.1